MLNNLVENNYFNFSKESIKIKKQNFFLKHRGKSREFCNLFPHTVCSKIVPFRFKILKYFKWVLYHFFLSTYQFIVTFTKLGCYDYIIF